MKIMKIPTVDNFHLINSSKRYHVYNHTTIHLLDMKYGHYGSNTLIGRLHSNIRNCYKSRIEQLLNDRLAFQSLHCAISVV
jgi:hypothetical protein